MSEVAPHILKLAFRLYCHRPLYLKRIVAGTARFDLFGKQTSLITPAEQERVERDLKILLERRQQAANISS
jgi:sRNA-binding protein